MRQDVDSRRRSCASSRSDWPRSSTTGTRPTTSSASGRCSPTIAEVVIPRVHRALVDRARPHHGPRSRATRSQDIMAPGVDQELKDWVARQALPAALAAGARVRRPAHRSASRQLSRDAPSDGSASSTSARCACSSPPIRLGYLRLARALLARRRRRDRRRPSSDLGFVDAGEDPAPFVEILRIVCEPLQVDARVRSARLRRRRARPTQSARSRSSNRLFKAPGHQVFLLRALVGLDGYLKAFGTVRNWHRLFRDVAVPTTGTP